jgi:hypothetical protein
VSHSNDTYGPHDQVTAAAGASSSSSSSAAAAAAGAAPGPLSAAVEGGVLQPKGIYLQGIPPATTADELKAVFAAYGKVQKVSIIGVKYHTTKCAFVDFDTEASAQQVSMRLLV